MANTKPSLNLTLDFKSAMANICVGNIEQWSTQLNLN